MPIVFVVGNRACPYHPDFTEIQKTFAQEGDDIFMCGGTVQPIYIPQHSSTSPESTNARFVYLFPLICHFQIISKSVHSNSKLRGVPNLVSTTMTLFYDTPYIQNASRYATYPAAFLF
jgi:hypothetical protein